MKQVGLIINSTIILCFTILFLAFPLKVFAGNLPAKVIVPTAGIPQNISYYVPWIFSTHEQPDFRASKTNSFTPQIVTILETTENGWALINTYNGEQWFYMNDNLRYIETHTGLFENKYDENPVGALSPQVVKIIEEDDNWLLIETWIGPKWVELSYIRPYVLLDVPAFNQRLLGYPTGCEIVSLGMMINYCIDIDIETMVSQMPLSDNPEEGFVGNPKSTAGFTIFPPALTSLLEPHLGSSYDMSGCSVKELKNQLNLGIPIVVWINGLGFNVHAVCLTGYDENGFYYNDPWTGVKNAFITYDDFYSIWDKPIFNKTSNTYYPSRKALSYFAIPNTTIE